MRYTAECPACSNVFEVQGIPEAERGLKCPKCDVGFIPEKIHQQKTAAELEAEIEEERSAYETRKAREAHEEKWKEYHQLRNEAGNCFNAGIFCMVATVVFIAIGFSHQENFVGWVTASSGTFSLMIVFLFFCQCLHIRAGLEKIANKE